MEIGRIKHMITEMTHKEPLREVAMERLGEEFVRSYFIHILFPLLI